MKNNEFKTEQENFWVNEFGKNYIERNNSKYDLATNLFTFSNIFNSREKISSVIEFGANIGMNLIAIKQLLPDVEIEAVEIFQEAYKKLVNLEFVNGYNQSIFDFEPSKNMILF